MKPFLTIAVTALLTGTAFLIACTPHPDPVPALPADAQCQCTNSYYRYVGGGDTVLLPNAFSPNGDGRNDGVRPVTSQTLAGYSMTIYQGATAVFHTTTLTDRWDGRANGTGNVLAAGDFVARIQFANGMGQAVNDCQCIHLLKADSCLHFGNLDPHQLVFEDQIDPATGTVQYSTAEYLCP